jgi:[ribosomal protein S5]-alanine N-acetyltransferase
MPFFPHLSEPLTGPAVQLRFAAERDIPEILIAHQDDPELSRRMGLRRPPSGAELGRRIDDGPADRATGTGVWLTIVAAGSDDCLGQLDVYAVDWDHGRAELVVWIAPDQRGRGLGTEALALVAHWLLEQCGLERVQLISDPDNAPLLKASRAAGFTDEGILRSFLRERGRRVDVTVLSLVAADLVPR